MYIQLIINAHIEGFLVQAGFHCSDASAAILAISSSKLNGASQLTSKHQKQTRFSHMHPYAT